MLSDWTIPVNTVHRYAQFSPCPESSKNEIISKNQIEELAVILILEVALIVRVGPVVICK